MQSCRRTDRHGKGKQNEKLAWFFQVIYDLSVKMLYSSWWRSRNLCQLLKTNRIGLKMKRISKD